MNHRNDIIRIISKQYTDVQAIYLFGTYGTEDEWPNSDVDIAVLLPIKKAKHVGSLVMSECWKQLVDVLHKDVDLINLRQVNTVFQNEIISSGRKIFCHDETATLEFEGLTLSFYQKLNQERKAILDDILISGKVLDV